jgi:hypothetical protein
MRTRLTAAVLSGLMIFSVGACSSDAADDTGTGAESGTTGGAAGATTDPLAPTE